MKRVDQLKAKIKGMPREKAISTVRTTREKLNAEAHHARSVVAEMSNILRELEPPVEPASRNVSHEIGQVKK